jgi:hypothetical protein
MEEVRMSELKTTKERIGTDVTMRLIGEINERSEIQMPELKEVKTITFDFMHINHINSSGIRFWIQFVQTIPPEIIPHFKNLPKIIVDQMSMVVGFMPKGSVIDSFEMPFFCDKCNKSEREMLQKDLHFMQATGTTASNLRLPRVGCGQTICEMTPDMLPKKYLRFLEIPRA